MAGPCVYKASFIHERSCDASNLCKTAQQRAIDWHVSAGWDRRSRQRYSPGGKHERRSESWRAWLPRPAVRRSCCNMSERSTSPRSRSWTHESVATSPFLPPEFWLTSFTDPVYLWEVCGVSSPSQFFLQEYLIFLRGGLMSFIIYGHIFIYFFSFSNLSLKAYSDKACWGSKWVDRYFSRITSFLG